MKGKSLVYLIVFVILSSFVMANTCVDSDNGEISNVKGSVSGLINGYSYSYNDQCETRGHYVKEYYCNGDNEKYTFLECDGFCLNGACVNTPDCVSDDDCKNIPFNYCLQGEKCTSLKSFQCSNFKCVTKSSIDTCVASDECKNIRATGTSGSGKIIGSGTVKSPECTDTDGGIDYYVAGFAEEGLGSKSEDCCYDTENNRCVDGPSKYLLEKSCAENPNLGDNLFMSELYECPYGCGNGACLQSPLIKKDISDFDYVDESIEDCKFTNSDECIRNAGLYKNTEWKYFIVPVTYETYVIVENNFNEQDGSQTIVNSILSKFPNLDKSKLEIFEINGNKVMSYKYIGGTIVAWESNNNLIIVDFQGNVPGNSNDLLTTYLNKYPSTITENTYCSDGSCLNI